MGTTAGDGTVGMAAGAGTCKATVLMVVLEMGLAVFVVLLQALMASGGISALVLVVYEHVVSSVVLSSVAFFLEKDTRPPLSFRIGCWAFFLGFLQITLCQLLETWSLRYVTASFQSSLLNTGPAVVFLLAVAAGRERFRFYGASGQAKLWGTLVSAAGATAVVLSTGKEGSTQPARGGGRLAGFLMIAVAVLANAAFSLLVERVAVKFSAILTLSALITISGTLQTAVLAAITEKNPFAWKIQWKGSHQLLIILYGGFMVSGLFYYVLTWCIHMKGPVFAAAFSPLLIVFSFFLEILFFATTPQLWSVVGVVLVVGGLYLLLWGKAEDYRAEMTKTGASGTPVESSNKEPLLLEGASQA